MPLSKPGSNVYTVAMFVVGLLVILAIMWIIVVSLR